MDETLLNQNEVLDNEQVEDTTNELDGESELIEALRKINSMSDDEQEEMFEEETPDGEEEQEQQEEESADEQKPQKKVQTPEENARFAAMRRKQEMEQKIQAELERLRNESPEFQLAKQLSEMYGVTPEEMLQQVRESQLQQEAQEKGVPIEFLRERLLQQERLTQLEQELNRLRFEQWQSRIEADTLRLKQEYPMLTDEDMHEAVNYILNVAQNVNLPLEQAVYAIHGKKIVDSLTNARLQEKLAAESGRKKSPIVPKSSQTSQATQLTPDEEYVAKQLGMSADEYIKYKNMQ